MTRLWLIRHGPTHQRAMTGWRDVPADLSDREALARLSAALPAVPVVSSDLRRAVETADAIAGDRPRRASDPDLREIDFGDWDGRTADEISRTDPDLSRAFWERPGAVAAPNGESWDQMTARVGAAVDRLAARDPELVIVAHMGAILSLFPRAGLTVGEALGHRLDPLGLSRIETAPGGGWRLVEINRRP